MPIMSSSRRRFHLKHPVVVDIGCSCRRPKLSSLFLSLSSKQRKANKYYSNILSPSTSGSLTTTTTTATTKYTNSSFSPSDNSASSPYSPPKRSKKVVAKRQKQKKKGVLVEESVAVEKESNDPYFDFRDSMLQMIVEKEIYGWDDLRELLHLFLSLNSPYHHPLILQAFAEIWNGVFSPGT